MGDPFSLGTHSCFVVQTSQQGVIPSVGNVDGARRQGEGSTNCLKSQSWAPATEAAAESQTLGLRVMIILIVFLEA